MKFEEIYAHMAEEYKTLAGVEPEDAADVSIRLKVLAGELYTVLCAAESLKLNCFPQTAAGEALDLHAEERGLVRKDAVKSVGTLTFSRRTALSYAAEIPAGTVCAASGENAVEYETTEAAVLPAGALTVTAAAQAVLGGRRGNAAKGAVNTLITPPAGIESVTNDVPFTGGADKEDDEALRTRLLRCFYALPNGSNTETYRRAALMTPGVKSVQVVPRANGVNTVAVYLYGDNGAVTDEVLGKVGETLEKLKEISVDVTVAAAVAVKKPVTVYVKPKNGCAFEDAKASCTAAITAYLNAFEVGEPFVDGGANPCGDGDGRSTKLHGAGERGGLYAERRGDRHGGRCKCAGDAVRRANDGTGNPHARDARKNGAVFWRRQVAFGRACGVCKGA